MAWQSYSLNYCTTFMPSCIDPWPSLNHSWKSQPTFAQETCHFNQSIDVWRILKLFMLLLIRLSSSNGGSQRYFCNGFTPYRKKKGWVPQSMEIWVSRPLMSSARATISAFSSLRYMSRFYSLLDLPHDVPHIFLCRSRPRLTLELNLHRVDLPTLTAEKWLAT